MGKRSKEEATLQSKFFTEFELRFPDIKAFHIPNGGFRDLREAEQLKRQGVRSGVWDIFIAYPTLTFGGLFIESKAPNETLTKEQQKFKQSLLTFYDFYVMYEVSQAIQYITDYITTNK